jgi:hypothetical protein
MLDPASGTFVDLLAADTPERDAAARATWDAITAAVVALSPQERDAADAAVRRREEDQWIARGAIALATRTALLRRDP